MCNMDNIKANKKFLEMMENANVGHNGGKPEADLWFVGLENNAGALGADHNQKLLDGTTSQLDLEHQDFTSKFNQKLRDLSGMADCNKVSQMYANANFYCANLYPFACTNIKDESNICALTGLSKTQYQFACDLMRRKTNQTLLTKNPNRIIVCFSVDFAENFMVQFIDDDACLGRAVLQLWKYLAAQEKYFQIEIGSDRINKMVFCPHPCAWDFDAARVKELIKR